MGYMLGNDAKHPDDHVCQWMFQIKTRQTMKAGWKLLCMAGNTVVDHKCHFSAMNHSQKMLGSLLRTELK